MIRTRNKGFHLTFSNGYTISVQIGPLNYCEKYPDNEYDFKEGDPNLKPQNRIDAEIAYWKGDGDLIKFEDGDSVKGWVTPDEIAEWIFIVKNLI